MYLCILDLKKLIIIVCNMFIKCNPEDFNYKRKNGFPILVSIMVSLKKNLL